MLQTFDISVARVIFVLDDSIVSNFAKELLNTGTPSFGIFWYEPLAHG